MASDLYYTKEFQKLSFGDKGLRVLASGSTSVADEDFCAIQSMEDSVITFNCNETSGDTSVTSLTLLAGHIVYGNLEDVAVASGKVIAYLR